MTVAEAAGRLGITKEAVRKRISRGTVRSDKAPDGTVRVYVPSSGTTSGTPGGTGDREELVEVLRAQLEDVRADRDAWKEQARRNDAIIAGLIERVPELEAPGSTDRGPGQAEAGDEGPVRGPRPQEAQTASSRPWWRRVFGG